jgi:hypothetical protein
MIISIILWVRKGLHHYYNFSYIKLQAAAIAVVGIPFSGLRYPQNVLILVSVSAYTGLSRFGFARPVVRVAGKPRLAFGTLPVFFNNEVRYPKCSPTQWGSGETRNACHAIIYYIDNKKNFDASLG